MPQPLDYNSPTQPSRLHGKKLAVAFICISAYLLISSLWILAFIWNLLHQNNSSHFSWQTNRHTQNLLLNLSLFGASVFTIGIAFLTVGILRLKRISHHQSSDSDQT